MAELGLQAEETFAANLIFVESRNTEKIKEEIRNGLFETCWQVHQKMLAVVRPKYIVCLGNGESDSAFSFVREKAADIKEEKLSKEKVGRYVAFKTFVGKFELDDGLDLAAKVIGVLHPSRWKCPHVLRERVLQDN
jgi:uracil-DNA glycosylase